MRKFCCIPLILLLLAGCQSSTAAPFIAPGGALSQTDQPLFDVTVPQGKTVTLYVERWQGADRLSQDFLVSFQEDSKNVMLQVNDQGKYVALLPLDSDPIEALGAVDVETPAYEALSFAWLTDQEVEQLLQEGMPGEVVVYAAAMGDSRGVAALSCNSVLEDPAGVEPCRELQLVRAVLE